MKIEELPKLDIGSAQFLADPEAAVAPLREEVGFAVSARGIEVLGHEACAELYRDQRFLQGTDDMYEAIGITEGPVYRTFKESLINIEGEAHNRQRRVIAPYFTPGRADEMRAHVRGWIAEWMEAARERGEIDYRNEIGRRLPSTLFCHMVGMPLADSDAVATLSEQLMMIFTFDPKYAKSVEAAHGGIEAYILDAVEEKRKRPGDDVISAMLVAESEGTMSLQELVDLGVLLLFGSTDTTNAQLCLNMLALADLPDQWATLKDRPERVDEAVLELVRYKPGAMSVTRVAPEEAVFRGVELPAESVLWADVFSANKDPAVYERPRDCDVTRTVRPSPLNFGMGRHSCIGRTISLVEQQEALRGALAHWSEFAVSGEAQVVGEPVMASLANLSLKFDA